MFIDRLINQGNAPLLEQWMRFTQARHRLIAQNVVTQDWIDGTATAFSDNLELEFEAGKTYKANQADWFAGRWSGLHAPADPEYARRNVETGIDRKLLDYVEKNHPQYMKAPEAWSDASLSSLENYAREQKPAPVGPEGPPVANEPDLPAWFKAMMQKSGGGSGGAAPKT